MKLSKMHLENFRKYESASFSFHKQFTVLIGENGAGKTTILDAAVIMLGTYFQGSKIKIRTSSNTIQKDDTRVVMRKKGDQTFAESLNEATLDATMLYNDHSISWQRQTGDRAGHAKELVDLGKEDRMAVKKGEDINLPLLLYYGSGRLWDKHRDIETEKPGSQLDAYRFCLDPKSDQKSFEKWFKKLAFTELQKQTKLPSIETVKKAVLCCVPDADDFYYDTMEDRVVINIKNEGVVPFNYLSDGYRNMIAMVADIAHRAVRLNPHLLDKAAEETKGIVLIDEIDLHLHPKWQRHVVRDLQKAFPNLQFIATTHSPFIIQSLDPGEVIDLSQQVQQPAQILNESMATPAPVKPFSNRSIEDIVEDVMGVDVPQRSQRYQDMYMAAEKYYKILEDEKGSNSPVEIERVKRELDELSAPFSDNVAYHAFLEMERIAAGFGKSGKPKEL